MNWFQKFMIRLAARIAPPLRTLFDSAGGTMERLAGELELYRERYRDDRSRRYSVAQEMAEALALSGAGGPWANAPVRVHESATGEIRLEQTGSVDIKAKERIAELELALEDRGWKRQLAIADTEFSRYGIQQIILISRLYRIKNPLVKRGIEVSAHYVFGRGLEVSSTDDTANEVLTNFFADPRNRDTLGQRALVKLEESIHTDGNLFFAFFTSVDDGQTVVRMLDPVEMEEIITNPDDHAVPWFYKRRWMQQNFDPIQGTTTPKAMEAWYVDIEYDPPADFKGVIRDVPVLRDPATKDYIRVFHVKEGCLPKWHFGCPTIYSVIDWARAYRHFLEDWSTITRALARFAYTVETQGGPAAISAFKQTLATTLGNDGQSIESNPPPNVASTFITGPGNKLQPMKTAGATTNPEQGRRVMLMVAAGFGLPETFFGDASTGSLATAQSLDRPTELKFLEAQERWREILQRIGRHVLKRSLGAPRGKLREKFKENWGSIVIEMVPRKEGGIVVYNKPIQIGEAKQKPKVTAGPDKADTITIEVKFPSILEHDIDKRVSSIVESLTLNGFEATGIDERTGIGMLLSELGAEDVETILEAMYPQKNYDDLVDRSEQMLKDKDDALNPPAPPPQPPPGAPNAGPSAQGDAGAPPQAPKPRTPHPKRVAAGEAAVNRAVVELRRTFAKLQARKQ